MRDFVSLQLLVSAVCVAHALYLRPYYPRAHVRRRAARALPAPPQPPSLAAAERPAAAEDHRRAPPARSSSRRAARSTPSCATAGTIGKPAGARQSSALCHTADQILAELASQPRKLDAARSFLTYYLDAAQRIVDGYASLSQRGPRLARDRQRSARAEASLDSVQEAFDRQLANVLEDRVLDLESEIELLEKTVHMDGMYSQTGGS